MNHLILGEQEFFADRIRRQLTQNLPTTVIKASELVQDLTPIGPTLFAEDRAVVVTNVQDISKATIQPLIDALDDPQPGLVIVLMHNDKGRFKAGVVPALKKKCEVHLVPTFDYKERVPWVMKEFADKGVRINKEIAETVLDAVGSDPRELASAISQLVADTEGQVTVGAVRAYYGATAEVTGFNIADALVVGDRVGAIRAARRALQIGVAPALIVAALNMKFSMIAKVYTSRQAPADIKDAPWKINQAMKQSRRWPEASISQAMVIIAELDAAVKGRGGEVEFEVERAITRIAALAK
ncbi:MAG: DNA polymerase III subunit delta [Corynebacterium sp.]|nr:DNA polymerase III subunit delta [Corynebacterium sp.]